MLYNKKSWILILTQCLKKRKTLSQLRKSFDQRQVLSHWVLGSFTLEDAETVSQTQSLKKSMIFAVTGPWRRKRLMNLNVSHRIKGYINSWSGEIWASKVRKLIVRVRKKKDTWDLLESTRTKFQNDRLYRSLSRVTSEEMEVTFQRRKIAVEVDSKSQQNSKKERKMLIR